jgi:hypothetical protein
MRLATPTKSVPPIFFPENPFAKNIQRKIIDEKFGDISFVVGEQQETSNDEVVVESAPVTFYAHRDILRECSTGILADICDSKYPKVCRCCLQSKSRMYHQMFSVIFYTLRLA